MAEVKLPEQEPTTKARFQHSHNRTCWCCSSCWRAANQKQGTTSVTTWPAAEPPPEQNFSTATTAPADAAVAAEGPPPGARLNLKGAPFSSFLNSVPAGGSASSVRAILRARSTYATRVHTHIHTVSFFYTSHLVCSLGLQHHTYVNTDEVFESCLLLVAAHTHCQLLLYGPSCVLARPTQRVCIHTFTLSFSSVQAIWRARLIFATRVHTHIHTVSFSVRAILCARSAYATRMHTHTLSAFLYKPSCVLARPAASHIRTHRRGFWKMFAAGGCRLPQCRPSGVLTQPMQRVCIHTQSSSSVQAIWRAHSTYATRVHTHKHTVIFLSAGHLACSLNLCNACAYTHGQGFWTVVAAGGRQPPMEKAM